MASSSTAVKASGWQARLQLSFEARAGGTYLARREHFGPLAVQRPFYPEPTGGCHVYLLHPPGGIVGGDALTIDVSVAGGAHALLTTPGASKIYRNTGEFAHINQQLQVQPGGLLEWLPQETIAFSASNSVTRTDVHLDAGADFCGWDIVCLGRPASAERFDHGMYRQHFRVWRDGKPLCIESNVFQGGSESLYSSWGLAGYTVAGTLLFAGEHGDAITAVRESIGQGGENCRFSITQARGVIVARYLGHSSEQAKSLFTEAWAIVRPALYAREAVRPRVWDT